MVLKKNLNGLRRMQLLSNSVEPWWTEKHLIIYKILNSEVDGLQQQRATLSFFPLSDKKRI